MPHHRLVLITSLLAFGVALSGCSSFDPSEWFNTKKPLPGERKNVFPQGVPGVPQGVPPELVEGYTPPVEPVPEPLPVQEQPKAKPRPKPRPKVAAAPRPVPAPRQQQQQTQQPAQQQAGGQAPWPAAPAPSQAAPASQSQSVFPDPPRR